MGRAPLGDPPAGTRLAGPTRFAVPSARVRKKYATRSRGSSRTAPIPNLVLASEYVTAGGTDRCRGAAGTDLVSGPAGLDNHRCHHFKAERSLPLSCSRASGFDARRKMGTRYARPHRPKRALHDHDRRPASSAASTTDMES